MKNFRLFLLPVSFSLILLASCSKQGPVGPQGIQGQNGSNGNANVKATPDSTSSPTDWSFGVSAWTHSFANPYLTSSFIKSGGFALVFMSYDNGNVWSELPVTYYTDSTHYAQLSYTYSTYTVQLYFTWNDARQHADPVTAFGSTCYFKVICVAPAMPLKHPETNWSNYESVIKLPEIKSQLQQ